jgi:hypothetical protein
MSTSFYFFSQSKHSAKDPLDGKFACADPPGSDTITREAPISLRHFSGQYWFMELPGGEHKALSTEEVADTLRGGRTARSISGPFATREEAAQSLERYWEMIMEDEDE